MILLWLERSRYVLSEDIKIADRGQELIELHLSKVDLLFEFSQAYSPRPPKEIVALCHYSPVMGYNINFVLGKIIIIVIIDFFLICMCSDESFVILYGDALFQGS